MDTNINTSLFELQIDGDSQAHLRESAKWGKFLSIMGFIFCGLFVLAGIFAGTIFASLGDQYGTSTSPMPGSFMGGLMTAVYIILALVYFFPCLFLFRYSGRMQVALRNNDQLQLNTAFANLRSLFKFLGILTIIVLAFYVIALLIAGLGAALSGV
jgi:hypothetical protein